MEMMEMERQTISDHCGEIILSCEAHRGRFHANVAAVIVLTCREEGAAGGRGEKEGGKEGG